MPDLTPLAATGLNLDALGPAEKEALSRLDDSEVAALVAILAKLNGGDEVSGYTMDISVPISVPLMPGGGMSTVSSPKFECQGSFVW